MKTPAAVRSTGVAIGPCPIDGPLAERAVLIGDRTLFNELSPVEQAGVTLTGSLSGITAVVVSLSRPEVALQEMQALPHDLRDREWQHLPFPENEVPDLRWEFEWMALLGFFLPRVLAGACLVLFDSPGKLHLARFAACRLMLDVSAWEQSTKWPPDVARELEDYKKLLSAGLAGFLEDYGLLLRYVHAGEKQFSKSGAKPDTPCGVFEMRHPLAPDDRFALTSSGHPADPVVTRRGLTLVPSPPMVAAMEIQNHLLDLGADELASGERGWFTNPLEDFLFCIDQSGQLLLRPLLLAPPQPARNGWQRNSLAVPMLFA